MLKIKNKRLFKAVFSVFMVVVICLATMGSVPIKVYSAYIDPALEKVLSRAADTDLIPVDIWLYEIDTEEVDEKVFAKTGLNREIISDEKRSADLTHEQVDAYIEAERTFYAEAQTKRSNEFLKQYSNIFTSKATENSEIFYVSKYAPSIQMELTPAQIAKLAKDLSVESICYSPVLNFEPASVDANNVTGASYARDVLGLTGSGIKIGILEAPEKEFIGNNVIIKGGLPERGSHNIPMNKIVFDPDARDDDWDANGLADTSWHASMVAAIIMGQAYTYNGVTYEGIAPDAMVYATFLSFKENGNRRNWRECAEWLLGRGVNIINMSMQADSNNGIYNAEDRWADHIAMQHNVHLIVSSGNYNEDIGKYDHYVTNPALAYNVITVGNLDTKSSPSLLDDEIYHESCYIEGSNFKNPHKPEIVAPGRNIFTPYGVGTGTSFAAPIVTGIVAQLCQANTSLKANPAAVKAILCASAASEPHSYYTIHNNFDKYGAGLVCAQYAYNTVVNGNYLTDYFPAQTVDGAYQEHTFTINSNKQKVRIALTWINYKYIDTDDHSTGYPDSTYTMPDLDLRIYDSNGNQVGGSFAAKGNLEISQIQDLPAGTYKIEIMAYTGSDKAINYSVAWWY